MPQKLLVNDFKWVGDISKFDESFIKRYNEESDEGYLIEADIQHVQNLHNLHNYLPFLPERMKIEKFEKLVANLHDKTDYVIHIRNLKQALNCGVVLKKVHRVIEFNQKFRLKQYIDINCELRKEAKNDFEKDLFKLVNSSVYAKTMENVGKHRYFKLVTSEKRRNYLVSEPNYHTTKFFTENLLARKIKKQIFMNKPAYLGLSILKISKMIMYE